MEEKAIFDDILEIFREASSEEDFGIDAIGVILALPDDQFKLMSEIFLIELEKSMSFPSLKANFFKSKSVPSMN